jgi:hypothetical protein
LPRDDPRGCAVEDVVIITLLEQYDASIDGRVHGKSGSASPPNCGRARPGPGLVFGHPLAFTVDGTLIVPWPVTDLVVTAAAQQNPGLVLRRVADAERKARQEAVHGYQSGRRTDADLFTRPEIYQKVDDEYSRPIREVLRSWCGAAAVMQTPVARLALQGYCFLDRQLANRTSVCRSGLCCYRALLRNRPAPMAPAKR